MNMLPVFNNLQMGASGDKETKIKFRRYMTIMDSMTEKELDEGDTRKLFEKSRIKRFAYGSGRSVVRFQLAKVALGCTDITAPHSCYAINSSRPVDATVA